jgi:hypothetical protein
MWGAPGTTTQGKVVRGPNYLNQISVADTWGRVRQNDSFNFETSPHVGASDWGKHEQE